jgi:hypothetical protein
MILASKLRDFAFETSAFAQTADSMAYFGNSSQQTGIYPPTARKCRNLVKIEFTFSGGLPLQGVRNGGADVFGSRRDSEAVAFPTVTRCGRPPRPVSERWFATS